MGAGAIARSAAAAGQPAFTAGRFSFEIDGINCGRIAGADGGRLEGNVVVQDQAPGELFRHKQVAGVKYEDITIQVGAGMGAGMYDWMQSSFEKGSTPRHISVVSYDASGNEKSRRGATRAFISSVTVPMLDRSSYEPAYLAVNLSAAKYITSLPQHGTLTQAPPQKHWLPSNFKLDIKGLETSRVAKIDSFTWKCSIAADGSTLLSVSDLGVTIPRADLSLWQPWFKNMLGGANDERDGTLTIFPAGGGAVLTFSFSNLGLYDLSPAVGPTGFVKATMYGEGITCQCSHL